ncbi:MAG: TlpA family protein disulfide reductase [Planctomycetaceae bacterium]|nr:TlpA family protein disulfide reductase [Planctomycetaceae bacterium]
MTIFIRLLVMFVLVNSAGPTHAAEPASGPTADVMGDWDMRIACPGGDIRFGLQLQQAISTSPTATVSWNAFLVNGVERIAVPQVSVNEDVITLNITHYDSVVTLRRQPDATDALVGQWKKRRGADEWQQMTVHARRPETAQQTATAASQPFLGRWSVKFEKSDDLAVAVFRHVDDHVEGTFLTTTGDYRFLSGDVRDGVLRLSCFDGGHAFLFHARQSDDGRLQGDFWSASTWHERWTATADAQAKLPDSFEQTVAVAGVDADALKFPGLDGVARSINDPQFAGKARIIYVFGSWCPNCHDAAAYFSQLQTRFGDQGLSILGLAFELTGDFERDRQQVQRYAKRHRTGYPILIAGLSDKAKASKRLPILDRVRSYPTTIFLDRDNHIRAVHTGFSGPATGGEYDRLRERFELLITELLED